MNNVGSEATNYRAVVFIGFDIHRSQMTSGFWVSVVRTSLKTSMLKNSGLNFLYSFCQVVGFGFFLVSYPLKLLKPTNTGKRFWVLPSLQREFYLLKERSETVPSSIQDVSQDQFEALLQMLTPRLRRRSSC